MFKLSRSKLQVILVVVIIAHEANSKPAGRLQLDSVEYQRNQQYNQDEKQQQSDSVKLDDQFARESDSFMQLHKLNITGNNVTCNDGSPIGYYKRLNVHSKSWVIYLQGGGFCGSEESCQSRWQRAPHLMSSNFWPSTKIVNGILSSESRENPYLWNANHIYLPYCSSDSWTGLAGAGNKNDQQEPERAKLNAESESTNKPSSFSFMGSKILEQVIESLYEDLPREFSLYQAKFILLAGDSAGATGVILNLDKINSIVQQKDLSVQRSTNCSTDERQQINNCEPHQSPVLRGLADSGWFLDNEPYDFNKNEPFPIGIAQAAIYNGDCDTSRCTPLESIKQAMRFWNGQVPQLCLEQYQNEPWRCYFGYRAYQTLKTPLFVVQWLYDEAQLMVDNIARPDTNGQWNYVNKVVNEMRASLENVTALFAPSCFSHSLIIKSNWNQININGFKLPYLLNTWEEQSLIDTTTPHAITTSIANEQTGVDSNPIMQPTFVSQPTFEALLMNNHDASVPQKASGQFSTLRDSEGNQFVALPVQETRSIQKSSTNSNRQKSRKRKRNNQQQRAKQSRHRPPSTTTESYVETYLYTTTQQPIISRETNDLSSQSANPLQDLIDKSLASGDVLYGRVNHREHPQTAATGRLGRSTIIDDHTLMLGNNMPEDSLLYQQLPVDLRWRSGEISRFNSANSIQKMPSSTKKYRSSERFRLIDSCGWPQCNRDCPVVESEYNLGTIIHF